jgi:hypothetical protein
MAPLTPADRPAGCQTPLYILERLLHGTDAWETLQALTRGEPGAQPGDVRNPDGLGGWTGKTQGELINCDNIIVNQVSEPSPPPPTGTSVSYSLRRLSRQRPDLYERVKVRELSAHAATVAPVRAGEKVC